MGFTPVETTRKHLQFEPSRSASLWEKPMQITSPSLHYHQQQGTTFVENVSQRLQYEEVNLNIATAYEKWSQSTLACSSRQ